MCTRSAASVREACAEKLPDSWGQRTLEHHFEKRPKARQLFEAFKVALEKIEPVRTVISKTWITYMTRVRFAALMPRSDCIRCGVWFIRRMKTTVFDRVVEVAPGAYVHELVPPEGVRDRAPGTSEEPLLTTV